MLPVYIVVAGVLGFVFWRMTPDPERPNDAWSNAYGVVIGALVGWAAWVAINNRWF